MLKFCKYCKATHEENELCPRYKQELKKHPEYLQGAANFATVASQNYLMHSQALDGGAELLNKLIGTSLRFEGTDQTIRDIEVFKRLSVDSFAKSGQFDTAQAAMETYANASDGFKQYLLRRLNGTGQEVDWLLKEKANPLNILKKASLPNGNVPGYDGIVEDKITKKIEYVTIKAAQSKTGIRTNAKDVIEAIKKGTLKTDDTLFGVNGTKDMLNKEIDKAISEAASNGDSKLVNLLQNAKENLKVQENNTTEGIQESTKRLTEKIQNGAANTSVTGLEIRNAAVSGGVIGGCVEFSISSIESFIAYKKGDITEKEALRDVGEATCRGAIVGAITNAVYIMLPTDPLTKIAGIVIGMYLRSTVTNVLDEIFGKGAYEQILNASGYVFVAAENVNSEMINISQILKQTSVHQVSTKQSLSRINANQQVISEQQQYLNDLINEL